MQRLLEAARRVRVESPNPLESFLRLDPSSNGTVSRIDFDQTLRVFGIASKVDRDLLCRRFELGHWTCDYLDFCRFVEISDNAALRHLLLQLSIEDVHFDDPLRSGFVGPKKFRDALSNNSSLTELQLQLMTSRFTHPTDANRVGYRQLLDEARECQYPERRRRWRDPALEDDYDDDLQSLDGWIDHTSVKSPNRWKPKAANGSSSWPVKSKSRVKLGCSVEELCTKLNHNRWECLVCGNTENPRQMRTCDICGAANPNLRGSYVMLECPKCFYSNPDTASKCDICGYGLRPYPRRLRDNSSRSPRRFSGVKSSVDGWRTFSPDDDPDDKWGLSDHKKSSGDRRCYSPRRRRQIEELDDDCWD